MAKRNTSAQTYGAELGAGIKQGLQGLNTICSPKKRKTCIRLIVIPLFMAVVGMFIGSVENNAIITAIGGLGLISLGLYQFYVGKFWKGVFYTLTIGGFFIGCIVDLCKLTITKTFKDANGFPVIY